MNTSAKRLLLILALVGISGIAVVLLWPKREAPSRQIAAPDRKSISASSSVGAPPFAASHVRANQAPVLDLASLPTTVRTVIDDHQPYLDRLKAVHSLKRELSSRETAALFQFLLERRPEDETQA